MAEPATRAHYARRGMTVEPTIGTLKTTLGLRRFKTHGLRHVRTEWQLACLAFNCRRLLQHRPR
jgi:hypothetical protein